MKILQICPCPFPSLGGPARTFRQFEQAVEARSIGFVNPDDGKGEDPVVNIECRVDTEGRPFPKKYYFARPSRVRAAEALIAGADIVFVHNFFLYPSIWTMKACRKHHVPYVVVLHGILDPWALRKSWWIKKTWLFLGGRQVLRHAAAVLCATQRERDKASEFFSFGQAQVVRWPCELPALAEPKAKRGELRAKLNLSEDDRVLLFFGRLHSMKRPVETVELLAGLRAENLKLLVVGPEWDVSNRQLQVAASRHGWTGLRVVGPVFGGEKYNYLAAADGYISMSFRENFNYTLAEAMAMGLPPILSEGNDLGWEFHGQSFSWQLPSDDRAEAARAVTAFASAPRSELERRGAMARRWVEENLGMDRFSENLHGLVREIVRSHR